MVWMFMAEEEEEEERRGSCLIHRESWMGRAAKAATAWLQLGGSWAAGVGAFWVGGGVSERGGEVRWMESTEVGVRSVFGWAGERRGEGEERHRERATSSSGGQSIGRFSPCFFVNSSAFFKNFLRSFEYSSARSALRGCSGWGSFTSAMRD